MACQYLQTIQDYEANIFRTMPNSASHSNYLFISKGGNIYQICSAGQHFPTVHNFKKRRRRLAAINSQARNSNNEE